LAAWLGTTERLSPSGSAVSTDRPTFVVLGTIEARKNHLMLLQIWERLILQFGIEAPRLLIIGQRGWECEQVFDLLDRSDLLRKAVVELSNCSDEALASHLASARALLFPSLIEGYGLPLIEALRAGTPVIASDLPVFREIGEGIPDFLDPLDEAAWEQAILDYAERGSRARQKQLQRLSRYRPPAWEDHFCNVDAWMEQL
jgi:glycosyltransferase involved in cell wall biosynthesis